MDQITKALLEYDEIDILELLDISTEDLVRRFSDKIHKRIDYIKKEITERADSGSSQEDQEEQSE